MGIELTRLEIAEVSTAVRFFSEEMIKLNGTTFWEGLGCAPKWRSIQVKLQKAVDDNNYVLDDEIMKRIVEIKGAQSAPIAPNVMAVKLFVRRLYKEYEFNFTTVQKAAKDALAQLDHDRSYPDRIEVDGEVVWEQPGPFFARKGLEALMDKVAQGDVIT